MEPTPVVSVVMPLYRSVHIGWLAMESLCSQKEIDFPWELVIAEEVGSASLSFQEFGLDAILAYKDRLKAQNCVGITYLKLNEWISLAKKYHILFMECDDSSELAVIQPADHYSPPYRLAKSYDLFKKGFDWIYNDTMILFNLLDTNSYIIHKHLNSRKFWMSFSMDLARKIPSVHKYKYVDQFLWDSISTQRKTKVTSLNLIDGFVVHGLNNISVKKDTRWKLLANNIFDLVPDHIIERLLKQREIALKWNITIEHLDLKPDNFTVYKAERYDLS